MKSHVFNIITVAVLASSFTKTVGYAATLPGMNDPQARGLAIAKISDETNLGYGDTKTELRMVLT